MQNIAIENNFSETAFLVKRKDYYDLRWFTPGGEIDFCGHATLGSAFVVKNFLEPDIKVINFKALCGHLTVTCEGDLLTMNAPRWEPKPIPVSKELEAALGVKILECGQTRDVVALVESVDIVKNMTPSIEALSKLSDVKCAIVTAKGQDSDFVCRVFAPAFGIDEDPATGSAHSSLIPYWSEKLGKTELTSLQLSKRGAAFICKDLKETDRVEMSGKGVCYLVGEILL